MDTQMVGNPIIVNKYDLEAFQHYNLTQIQELQQYCAQHFTSLNIVEYSAIASLAIFIISTALFLWYKTKYLKPKT